MENADKTINVRRDTTISDLGNDLSMQGHVEMNNTTLMESSSVIFGDQNLVQDGVIFIQDKLTSLDFNNTEDQTSTSEEFEWNDDSGGGSTDAKHIKKNQTRSTEMFWLKMMIEVIVASLKTVVSLKYLQLNHKLKLNYHSLSIIFIKL